MVLTNERVLAVYVKPRAPKVPTPDIDRVKIFVISTRKSHLDEIKHVAQQFSDSTINAEVLRRIWKNNYGGRIYKADEILDLFAQELVVKHGNYGQIAGRDNCHKWSCPYKDHCGA
eukprot:7217099-Karenia_brevis.AAC.1